MLVATFGRRELEKTLNDTDNGRFYCKPTNGVGDGGVVVEGFESGVLANGRIRLFSLNTAVNYT